MTERVVAEIRKNSRQVIRVTLQEYKGQPICSVRLWFEAEDGEMRPSKDGINFKTELLPDIAEGLLAAVEAVSGAAQSGSEAPAPPARRSLNS